MGMNGRKPGSAGVGPRDRAIREISAEIQELRADGQNLRANRLRDALRALVDESPRQAAGFIVQRGGSSRPSPRSRAR